MYIYIYIHADGRMCVCMYICALLNVLIDLSVCLRVSRFTWLIYLYIYPCIRNMQLAGWSAMCEEAYWVMLGACKAFLSIAERWEQVPSCRSVLHACLWVKTIYWFHCRDGCNGWDGRLGRPGSLKHMGCLRWLEWLEWLEWLGR